MASFQNRKSTAPEPPPLSQLWQMSGTNPSFQSDDAQSVSTAHTAQNDLMNDEEMHRILSQNINQSQRKSITTKYNIPKPPLHATHAIISPKEESHFDKIMKTNPYKPKKKRRILTAQKRTIRPVNALTVDKDSNGARTSYYSKGKGINNVNKGYKHTITNMKHHRKESKSIDIFLRNRMSETELQKRHILPDNIESNAPINSKEYWTEKQQRKEQIKTTLTKRLSAKFRPNTEELYDRGIYVTNPKDRPEHAAWIHANHRRRNSQSLATKFNNRLPPNEVLNKGYIRQNDYKELFEDSKYRPQTQPTTPNEHRGHMHRIVEEDMSHINKDKLNNKIAQRPTLNEMKSRGIMYDDPSIPAGLQQRKRELHRRRASAHLEEFLTKRPKPETLKRRHIIVEQRDKELEEQTQLRARKKLQTYINRDRKRRKKKGKIWITEGQIIESKRRESIKISDFLLQRQSAENLVRKHILPSMPYSGGYDEIKADFSTRFTKKRQKINKLFTKQYHRTDITELERRGYVPREFISHSDASQAYNHDFDKAAFEYKRRRKQSRTDLEKLVFQRPEMDNIPHKYFVPMANDDEKVIDTSDLKLDINNSGNGKRGTKRKRIQKTAQSRASLILEQFLPVRPEIQQLWDKNILPSLPPSPHKIGTFQYKGKNRNKEYENLFGFDPMAHTPSPLQQSQRQNREALKSYSPVITPQSAYIDKRRNRRQDSIAMLELKLLERAPRESLFELGILIMSPAPSPPPLSVIQDRDNIANNVENGSIFERGSDSKEDNSNNNAILQSRKRRKLMNGTEVKTHNKRSSLVLDEYLGSNVATRLDEHLYNRPDPIELINRGIVPTYSFAKKSIYDSPNKFAKHRRNMTVELQNKLESKLKNRPMLNDLPKKIYSIDASIKSLYSNDRISYAEQTEIREILLQMKESHDKDIDAIKERYWALLVEGKDKYKHLAMVTTQTEMKLRQKLEAMTHECQTLSTHLITKNTQMKEQNIEFQQRLIRLQQEYKEQYERQETRIQMTTDNNKELIKEIEKGTTMSTNSDLIDINYLFEGVTISSQDLQRIKGKIHTIENKYSSDLQRERSMHRKFNEQSERVKQTLVDEINKMELQHQSKLHNLENQIVLLKEENRSVKLNKDSEIKQLQSNLAKEIDKERNIATIMVEDLDEEKTRLIQEMEEIRTEYDKKLKIQKQQIAKLREVAEDAAFYGNNQSARPSTERLSVSDISHNIHYKKMKRSKEKLEKQVLFLSEQILSTFQNNLNDNILEQLNLQNINND